MKLRAKMAFGFVAWPEDPAGTLPKKRAKAPSLASVEERAGKFAADVT